MDRWFERHKVMAKPTCPTWNSSASWAVSPSLSPAVLASPRGQGALRALSPPPGGRSCGLGGQEPSWRRCKAATLGLGPGTPLLMRVCVQVGLWNRAWVYFCFHSLVPSSIHSLAHSHALSLMRQAWALRQIPVCPLPTELTWEVWGSISQTQY